MPLFLASALLVPTFLATPQATGKKEYVYAVAVATIHTLNPDQVGTPAGSVQVTTLPTRELKEAPGTSPFASAKMEASVSTIAETPDTTELPRLRALRGTLDRAALADAARRNGYEVYPTDDGGAVLLPSLKGERAYVATISALVRTIAAKPEFPSGAPVPLTLAGIAPPAREAVRADLEIASGQRLSPETFVYGGIEVEVVIGDGERERALSLDATRFPNDEEERRLADASSIVPPVGERGARAFSDYIAERFPLTKSLHPEGLDLYGDLALVRWGTAADPKTSPMVFRRIGEATERRAREAARLLDSVNTDLLPELARRSPIFRALAASVGGGADRFPPEIESKIPRMFPRPYGFADEETFQRFRAGATVRKIRIHPRLNTATKGADGTVTRSSPIY